MEHVYLIAWGLATVIAVWALVKWNDFEAWYHDLDRWYSAILDEYAKMLKMWHKSHDTVLSAAQDLDKQITDYRNVIAENNIKIAMLEKQVSDCHEIIDDLDAEVAMLHTNMTEMFMENQALQAERNGYYKELNQTALALDTAKKLLDRPKCPKCNRFLKKDGICSNEKCKDQFRDATKKVEDDEKPLLADAKVGDICKIIHINRASLDDIYDSIDFVDDDGVITLHKTGGYWKDGSGISPSMYKVIATEPLAPEGSSEWAWQQMLLGNVVHYPSREYPDNQYKLNGKTVVCLNGRHVNKTVKWDKHMDGIVGWQIYSEHIVEVNKKVEADENIDLTDAPFEGLSGVKEGDSVLFSDGVVRKVKRIDFNHEMPDRIVVSPSIAESSGNGYGCVFEISTGKHWENRTPIRAIRIATPLDLKLYDGVSVFSNAAATTRPTIHKTLSEWAKTWAGTMFKVATPPDLTSAPFEGLDGVKEGDPVLFSDGVVRKVVNMDRERYINGITYPAGLFAGGKYFNLCDGIDMCNSLSYRAIRIATPLDLKLYGGGE